MHEHKDIIDTLRDWFETGIPKKIIGLLVAGFVSVMTTEKQNKAMTFWAKVTLYIVSMFVGWTVYEAVMLTNFNEWAFVVGMAACSFGATILDAIRQQILPLVQSVFKWAQSKFLK